MLWLSWRQFRVQALVGAGALALFALYLLYLGVDIRHAGDTYHARCQSQGDCGQTMQQFWSDYQNTLLFLAAGLGVAPAILGAFWGAPLVAREAEAGTHRLVWNQSVTRRRWLIVKLVVTAVASVLWMGASSLLLTWAASPIDQIADDRFSTIVFGARNIAPVGYAVFGTALGAIVGLLVRRTVPAIALTLFTIVVVQLAMPNLVRPHFMSPETLSMPMTAQAINQVRGLGSITGAAVVRGVTVPNAWVTEVSELRTASGEPLAKETFDGCFYDPPKTGATGTFGDTATCLGELDLHIDVAYQPNERYWPFQLIETALYLALGGLLAAFALWRIHRV